MSSGGSVGDSDVCLCGTQVQGEGDQVLLGTVVQVAIDAPAGGIKRWPRSGPARRRPSGP
jgi:hypothetical protein